VQLLRLCLGLDVFFLERADGLAEAAVGYLEPGELLRPLGDLAQGEVGMLLYET